jgi:hypothetical protein
MQDRQSYYCQRFKLYYVLQIVVNRVKVSNRAYIVALLDLLHKSTTFTIFNSNENSTFPIGFSVGIGLDHLATLFQGLKVQLRDRPC